MITKWLWHSEHKNVMTKQELKKLEQYFLVTPISFLKQILNKEIAYEPYFYTYLLSTYSNDHKLSSSLYSQTHMYNIHASDTI